MSINAALGAALTGLRVNQKAIEIASHNVANAHTEGYSRQVMQRQTVAAGGVGGGVATAAIARTVDDFVIREIRTQSAALGADTVRSDYLSRTQDLFGSLANNTSFTAKLTDLATRLEALANEPESATRRLDLVQAAQSFALGMNEASRSIQSMRRDADAEIAQGVQTINDRLGRIADLNKQIVHRQAVGQSANELLDARDAAVAEVAELVDVQSFTRESGELVLYTRGGKPLVDSTAHLFGYTAASSVTVDTGFDSLTLDGTPIGAELQSGRLKALAEMRDQTLPGLQAQMDALSEKVRDQINLAHNRGTAQPAPAALTGTRSFADVAAEQITLSSPVRVAALDAGGVIQAYYDIPAGSYTVAGLRDLVNAQMGGRVTASAANGGGFSLAATGAGMGVALVDLSGAAADATVTHSAAGTTREYRGLSNFLGLNDLMVTPGRSSGGDRTGVAGLLAVRPDIAADPSALARGRLHDGAAPVAGQTAGITSGDTRALAGISAALDTKLSLGAVGGLPAFTGKPADYATQILSANAQQASAAASRVDYQTAVVGDLTTKAAATSGVSIDEEMANLVAWQNAYAASARVVTVASEMLELLTSLR